MKKLDTSVFEDLGYMVAAESDMPPPMPQAAKNYKPKQWEPYLNPGTQQEVYKDKHRALLVWAEKGSGKTWGLIQKMVKHCVTWSLASAFVVVQSRTQAEKGGAWEKLITQILPEWNRQRGLIYMVREDRQHNPVIWLINDHRTFSNITLLSYPYGQQLKKKAPGIEPSFVFVDELTSCDSEEYYDAFAAQLGRRTDIPYEQQQYVAACNPAGESNWVYQKWFVDNVDEETGEVDEDFHNIYVPAAENKRISKKYLQGLKKTYKKRPIELARLVGGEWIDMPSGDSHFGDIYSAQLHVRPLMENGRADPDNRLMPLKAHPVIIGIDSGSRYHAFSFMQYAPIDNRMKYLVFDEIVILGKSVPYYRLMPIVMRVLKFWMDTAGVSQIIPISDASALNVYRPAGAGSFDYKDMETVWNGRKDEIGVPTLRIVDAPKFNGSVAARLSCMRDVLAQEQILISSACTKHQSMLLMLESEKQKPGEEFDPGLADTVKRSPRIHIWDACSYVLLTGKLKPQKLVSHQESTQTLLRVA